MNRNNKSVKIFKKALNGWDNSTGDYNYLMFKFIDRKGLQKEFKEFLNGELYPQEEE